jgi:hypothetical protein
MVRPDGDKQRTDGSKYVKCGTNIDHKYTHIICTTRFKSVVINMAKMRNSWDITRKIHRIWSRRLTLRRRTAP